MTLREELSEYAGRSAGLIDDSLQMDEENTKRKIIGALLSRLGWDILTSDGRTRILRSDVMER